MQNNVIQNPQDIRFEGDGTVTKQVDLDDDGDFDFNDAIVLATSLNSEDAVDFNGDGEISFDDAVAMNYAIGTQRSFDPDTGEATFPKYNSLGRFNSLSTALSWYSLNPNINEQGPKNVSIRSDLDLQGNNIYNVGNINQRTGGGGGGGEVETFGYSNVATDSTSGFETIRAETFNPDKGVSVLGGYAEVTQDISYGDEPVRARIRVTYEDGSEKTFESVGIKVSPNDPGYTGDPPAPIYPSDTLKQPAVTEIHFEYKGSRSGGSDDEDRAKFRIDLIQGGTGGGGGEGGSLSGSPVFGSVSYTKMGETTEYVAGSSSTGGVSADFDSVKTMSSGDSVSVSRTAQLGGTTKFRVLGGVVNLDTDGPPGGYSRHFASALQRDLGYIQVLVDGEVVNEVQNLNEWSDSDRIVYFETMVGRNREPTITTDPISVETGDTVTARVVADQEVDTDEVGSGCCGKFYQYVVLKRVDK